MCNERRQQHSVKGVARGRDPFVEPHVLTSLCPYLVAGVSWGSGSMFFVGCTPQMSFAYSSIVRSDENFPAAAMFINDIWAHLVGFCKQHKTIWWTQPQPMKREQSTLFSLFTRQTNSVAPTRIRLRLILNYRSVHHQNILQPQNSHAIRHK